MTDLQGKRILIVEDEYVIATELALEFERAGAEIIGPVPTAAEAVRYVERTGMVEGAVLDVKIVGGTVFAVAEALSKRNIPFVFYTALDETVIPVRYHAAECLRKPADWQSLARALFEPPLMTVLH